MKKNMEKTPHNREKSEDKMVEVVKRFKEDSDFEVLDLNPTKDSIDKEEIDKILDNWKQGNPELLLVQYTVELDSGKKCKNSIDKVKVLLWKQSKPEKDLKEKKQTIEPERNRYEGVIAKFRRVESESGYNSEKFYLDNDQGLSDLKSHIRWDS